MRILCSSFLLPFSITMLHIPSHGILKIWDTDWGRENKEKKNILDLRCMLVWRKRMCRLNRNGKLSRRVGCVLVALFSLHTFTYMYIYLVYVYIIPIHIILFKYMSFFFLSFNCQWHVYCYALLIELKMYPVAWASG